MVEFFQKQNKVTCVMTDRETGRKTVGRAKCHPDDEFDFEYGKKLAFARAKSKEVEHEIQYLKKCIKSVQQMSDSMITDYMIVLNRVFNRRDDVQEELEQLESRHNSFEVKC